MIRADSPVTPPVVLTIAGSDSGGGAGIQADLKTIEAGGAFGTSAITSVTAQNTTGVADTHLLPTDQIAAQIEAVRDDFAVAAVKTGMLATTEIVELVTERAHSLPNLVVDPVMVATSGDRLLEPDAVDAYEGLIAEAALVTPNADETELLTDIEIDNPEDAAAAGRELLDMGADGALLKGGHVPGEAVIDVLVTEESVTTFRHDRIDTEATHGSGCTLSSAIATELAHGAALETAVADGIDLLSRAVRYNLDVGKGPGAVHHLVETRNEAARHDTSEAVERVVSELVESDIRPLVPDGGMVVAGATPYAERPDEVAAVEGRIARTLDGVRPNRGVRFGVSTDAARRLLAARDHESTLRFAATCRLSDGVEQAVDASAWTAGELLGSDAEYGSDAVDAAFDASAEPPTALLDRDAGTLLLLAPDAETLIDRLATLRDAASEPRDD